MDNRYRLARRRSVMEPLCGAVQLDGFSPVWPFTVARSAPTVPGFRGISSLAALTSVFHDPALRRSRSQTIPSARQAQKNVGGKGRSNG